MAEMEEATSEEAAQMKGHEVHFKVVLVGSRTKSEKCLINRLQRTQHNFFTTDGASNSWARFLPINYQCGGGIERHRDAHARERVLHDLELQGHQIWG